MATAACPRGQHSRQTHNKGAEHGHAAALVHRRLAPLTPVNDCQMAPEAMRESCDLRNSWQSPLNIGHRNSNHHRRGYRVTSDGLGERLAASERARVGVDHSDPR